MRPEAESGGRIREGSDRLFQSMTIWKEMASALPLLPERTGYCRAMCQLGTPGPRKMGRLHLEAGVGFQDAQQLCVQQ